MKRPCTEVELVDEAAAASNGPATCDSPNVLPLSVEPANHTSVVSSLSPTLSWRKSSHSIPTTPWLSPPTLGMNACAASDLTTRGDENVRPPSVELAILICVLCSDSMSL